MASVELTPKQAKALRLAAREFIEGVEEQFRSGEWEQWEDEVACDTYAHMALLFECLDLLLPACPRVFDDTILGRVQKEVRDDQRDG